ncbi:MAG: YggS family pyridoxal phosphate-dependent enzyme [Pseudomonadota bacterium]
MSLIVENLAKTKQRLAKAAQKSGRDVADIKLVTVSKNKSVADILAAYDAGQLCFGENYAQEFRDKHRELYTLGAVRRAPHDIEWHFIGHLQRNKVKYVAPFVSWVQTIDSLELAYEINKRASQPINCLLEVNLAIEASKTGIAPDRISELVQGLVNLANIKLKGLMIIPPYVLDPEASRPYFKKLRQILAQINAQNIYPQKLAELSMGMSHDFEVAIEEGATIVRVGTAIFGERK